MRWKSNQSITSTYLVLHRVWKNNFLQILYILLTVYFWCAVTFCLMIQKITKFTLAICNIYNFCELYEYISFFKISWGRRIWFATRFVVVINGVGGLIYLQCHSLDQITYILTYLLTCLCFSKYYEWINDYKIFHEIRNTKFTFPSNHLAVYY